VVSYASDVKFNVLGVSQGPVVSPEAAVEMAIGAKRVLGADVGLSLTGVAGPEEQDGHRPGTLCIGVALPDGTTASSVVQLPGMRDQMRQLSVISALDFLRRQLREA
jgi:nicotinamide-nucleotide amidase